jgi:hypothetical protein
MLPVLEVWAHGKVVPGNSEVCTLSIARKAWDRAPARFEIEGQDVCTLRRGRPLFFVLAPEVLFRDFRGGKGSPVATDSLP